ncbi:MAG: hypothetical protein HYS65_14590 [Betaproteobacteria bacterium]|nr:hypothetical protein [Betaproteobacteria bacterium]
MQAKRGLTMELKSRHYAAPDVDAAMELCSAKGWTDGLPVVPPTEARISAMLAAAGLEPDLEIAFIENRQVSVTAEKVAINAVLAGCKPEYMPVVIAAVEALADPLYGYHGPATSTGGSAVFMVVNGPIARELDINCGDNLFGPGWRANATIGRAVRLVMRNTIGTLPGVLDRSSLGHGGKYSFCIAENEAESPWPPLHVEACANMRICAGTGRHPQYALVFAGEHMATMAKAGWTREDVQRYCFEHTRISTAELKRINLQDGAVAPGDETEMHTLVEVPQDFLVIAAGGNAGVQSAYIPGWGSKSGSQSVTREIRRS